MPTVTGLAHLLGPKWSGLMVEYPVILHSHYGGEVMVAWVRGRSQ